MPTPGLSLPAEELRAFGYAVVDAIVDRHEHLRELPVASIPSRTEMEALLRTGIPEGPSAPGDVLEEVLGSVFANTTRVDHPRFFAYVPGPGNVVGVMADALAAGFNPFVGSWVAGAGAAEVELVTVDWLRQICGLPPEAGGLFVSGGSMANLTALATARHQLPEEAWHDAVIYASDQAHSAVTRGARILGFAPDRVRTIRSDDGLRMDMAALRRCIAEDREKSLRPFCVVGNAGTTNSGAIDPLDAMADLCEAEGLWFHVDGAYGAAAAMSNRARPLLAGLGRAHSIALDPHKWLFQPFECSCVIVRKGTLLRETFRAVPACLKDSDLTVEEVNFRDWGVQLTRGFRALKLWMSLKVFGAAAFRQAIDWGIMLAEHAEARLRSNPQWEIVTPAQIGIVTFRYRDDARTPMEMDTLQRRITEALTAGGYAMLSTTELRGRVVLRLCTINPHTAMEEIEQTIAILEEEGARCAATATDISTTRA
ncbi:MAG TPA: aminotransferase class I/II-fold pyridoxal phosphate-dependent enzyme [Candidatus Kapabacteria bacterium]|nr:aminotransferase class I/II-fold pyridoxal phosphate-dependent enzyme [Candidatus Kapabacteria bacterium]